MSDRQIQQLGLELSLNSNPTLSGFRLKYLEVSNWGTFHGQTCRLNLEGMNALLTGDIGSGKSTLVDAVTTLLVPAHRVAYNKAAGADVKERNLRSYVLGFYKSERNEIGGSSKPVALRGNSDYSVILGVFHNAGYDQTVTLAQVFWMKDLQGKPERFFVAAERALSIKSDFANFGSDISKLRKRLKASNCEVFDAFSNYGSWFRRRFGIENEQALELFHQTVSMKSVGNLTDFVRTHMLEPFDVESRLSALIHHFDDLNTVHEAVLRAAKQITMLLPLVADCRRRTELNEQCDELRACRDALKIYFARLKESLLDKRIKILHEEWVRLEASIHKEEENIGRLKNEESQLRKSIAENGGDRLERLSIEIQQKQNEFRTRKSKFDRYSELLHQIGLAPAQDESDFFRQQKIQEMESDVAKNREAEVQNEYVEETLRFREGKLKNDELEKEVKSLKSRRSNIPLMQIGLRDDLCKALKLKEDDLPFVGELLQIRENEKDWEGAAERLLRNFGLSLIVPDIHYAAVSDWVDRTHLKGRMVYYRVKGKVPGDLPVMESSSLAKKIDIKPDSPYFDWLERELSIRFDIACCESAEEFRRRSKAISINGQVKMPGERHEKDDRHRIDDRSRYILGWTNTAKILTLENQLKSLQSQLANIASKMSDLQTEKNQLAGRLSAFTRLEEYKDFRELDWQSVSIEVARLEHEKKELETASDVLKQLSETLNAVLKEIIDSDKNLLDSRDKRSKTEQKQADAQSAKDDIKLQLDDPSNAEHLSRFDKLEAMRQQALGEHTLTVEACTNREQDLRAWLQSQIDSVDKKLRDLRERIVAAMTKYKTEFQLETQEVDASVESAGEFESMLKKLQEDDLPRWESRFKELLNENTIREVANFQSQLTRERETIKERISQINGSLTQIDYNPGRYIELEAQLSQDADIRQFQQELRSCTEGSFTGSDDAQYSESKFLQVKAIIERFRGREGQTDLDKKWTQRVTDVRNWFTFGASERWHEDKSEHEHYSDSSGKSGGQKEKLAYTILAASLAYQFGLAWGETRSRTFRFVVIDEAFGRGSDDSAQYGLKLFDKLNLQLLVVTPLQKIHIIEPFVRNVGFVHNDGGSSSKLRNLTIEEYHAEKTRLSL